MFKRTNAWILVLVALSACASQPNRTGGYSAMSSDLKLCKILASRDSKAYEQRRAYEELKSRQVDSCLAILADERCPQSMQDRGSCLVQEANKISREQKPIGESNGSTEVLVKGLGAFFGVLPF